MLLALWGIIALALVRKGSLRLYLIPFLGLLLPYFFYLAIRFLMGDLLECLQGYGDFFQDLAFSVEGFSWLKIAVLGFLLLVSMLPLLLPYNYTFEKSLAVRTKITMTMILLVFGLFMLFIGGDPMQSGVFFLALAILFSYEMAYLDRLIKWADITFIVLVLSVIALHYIPLFI